MQQVLRHKLGLTLFVVIVMISNFVYAAEMVRWQDLTFAISPQDDPFYGLNYDARLDLETLLELDRKEKDGNAIDSDLVVKAKAAREQLKSFNLDGDLLLKKYHTLPEKIDQQRTQLRQDIIGKKIRIAGYIVPIEFSGDKVVEFLLVPFAGACIHTPPPPSNQIIYVPYSQGIGLSSIFDPYIVEGQLTADGASRGIGLQDGQAEFEVGYKLEALSVVPYER